MVRNVDDGAFYRFAGGAPLVTRCAIGPGCVSAPTIDNRTILHNGTNGPTPAHLRQVPADGTTLQNLDDGAFWRVAGGAPLKLGGCAAAPRSPSTTDARAQRDRDARRCRTCALTRPRAPT